ncbi:MAG: LysE family translocator [Rhodovibrio sp.]|nr:LysE family translocator [Rhodovibrio sp.]
MDSGEILISVAAIWGLAALVPGPDVLAIARSAALAGRGPALATVGGITLGTLIWGLAGFFGVSALFQLAPSLYLSVKLLGSCYLVWVGLTLLRAAQRAGPATPGAGVPGVAQSLRLAALNGLLVNLANPKTALFVASLYATVLPAEPGPVLGAGVIGVSMGVSAVWYACVAYLLSTRAIRRGYAGARRWLSALAGLAFIGFGVRLLAAR